MASEIAAWVHDRFTSVRVNSLIGSLKRLALGAYIMPPRVLFVCPDHVAHRAKVSARGPG
jgi:hypothetical protein